MKRPAGKQSKHDQRVRQLTTKLLREDWRVKADLPGYQKPDPIGSGKKVPDIEATKRGRRKIIEVETPDSLEADREQQSTFRRHAGQKPNTTFDIDVTN